MSLIPKSIIMQQANRQGTDWHDVFISGSNLFLQTDDQGNLTASNINADVPFVKNTTILPQTTIKQYDSIFNPFNLLIQNNNIFIIENNADYYVLGDLVNSGSIVVNGTLKIGGVLHNIGSITGTGVIE